MLMEAEDISSMQVGNEALGIGRWGCRVEASDRLALRRILWGAYACPWTVPPIYIA